MTVTEREDDELKASSNAKVEEEEEEEEEDGELDLLLEQLLNEPPGDPEEEEPGNGLEDDEIDLLLEHLLKQSSRDFNDLITEVEELEESMKVMEVQVEKEQQQEEEEDSVESKITAKRARIDVADHQEESSKDPLEITKEIVSKYLDFIEYIIKTLKDNERRKEEMEMQKRWRKILKRGTEVVESLIERSKKVGDEMERMKNNEKLKKEYSFRKRHVFDIVAQLRDMNAGMDQSQNLRMVSDINCTDKVRSLCLDELARCKEELNEMLDVIKELKEVEAKDDHEHDDDEETE